MNTLTCKKCGAHSQSDRPIKACPVCETPNPDYREPAPIEENAGGGQSTTAPSGSGPETASPPAPTPAPAPALVPTAAVVVEEKKTTAAAIAPAPPIAPKVPLATAIEQNAAIALDDVNEIATIITKSFAGTPVATIFALLGPAAGIGAAVLHQHLQFQGFDLSKLKTIEPIA